MSEPVDQPGPDDQRQCRNCAYWRKATRGGNCYHAPPAILLMTVAEPVHTDKKILTAGQQTMAYQQVPASGRPATDGDDFCARHRYDDEASELETLAQIIESVHATMLMMAKASGVPSGRVTTFGAAPPADKVD